MNLDSRLRGQFLSNFVARISTENVIGCLALFYFSSLVFLRGGIADILVVLMAVGLFVFYTKKNGITWWFQDLSKLIIVLMLLAYGSWSIFTVWYHDGAENYYEVPSKFFIGSFVFLVLMRFSYNFKWLLLFPVIVLVGLSFLYFGSEWSDRFSPLMNATKFGNILSALAILTLSLAFYIRSKPIRALYVFIGLCFVFFTIETGTRGALLPILAFTILVAIYMFRTISFNMKIGTLLAIFIASYIIFSNQTFQARYNTTLNSIEQIQAGNLFNSIGVRLHMWRVGIEKGLDSPIIGAGYDYASAFFSSEGNDELNQFIGSNFEGFHSAYIDTFFKRGLIGVFLMLLLILSMLALAVKNRNLLILSPLFMIAFSGLSDSVLDLGITSSFLIIGVSFLSIAKLHNISEEVLQ